MYKYRIQQREMVLTIYRGIQAPIFTSAVYEWGDEMKGGKEEYRDDMK